ncbi:MAG: TylF/MycF/NovP-related O-methyltransferase [Promethearchaeota archaeon]
MANKLIQLGVRNINKLLRFIGLQLSSLNVKSSEEIVPSFDMESDFNEIFTKCKTYTMTSIERMYALYKATQYVVENKISGDIVECGVWKGGSMMIIALTLLMLSNSDKKLYLYDTYEGMSEPTDFDVRAYDNYEAKQKWAFLKKENRKWDYASLDEVKKNLLSTNYPKENLIFIKGKVEETIPQIMPEQISLLRLDTDWYESTLHELQYLYPKLSKNGIILLDDYGHWRGAKKAVDKYFNEKKIKILLHRIDNTGRIGIKT